MESQLQKAIKLAKKTGDKLIVFDSQKPDIVYVVMSLDEYEKLAVGQNEARGLTEGELLDKINRDIAIWKSEQEFTAAKTGSLPVASRRPDASAGIGEDYPGFAHEGGEYSGPAAENFSPESGAVKEKARKNSWRIPPERKEGAEEIIDEDRQYLLEDNIY